MLTDIDPVQHRYTISLNNASDGAEVMADLSYLFGVSSGVLVFDFSHMAAQLTLEERGDFLPGNLGYQPTRNLIEVIAAIETCTSDRGSYPHQLSAILPDPASKVGNFLVRMDVPKILAQMALAVSFQRPANKEIGEDDSSRQNLISLASIELSPDGRPNFGQLREIRERTERVFLQALPHTQDLAACFTGIVNEAVDNAVEYGAGGIIGGLYYPRAGEVEITLVNRKGGFGGATVAEELEALIAACEGHTTRITGGGNGISELSRLTASCFGTLMLRNGGATLYLQPDGSVTALADDYGLPTPGAAVTILLQLLPANVPVPTETLAAYTDVLRASLAAYR